MPGGELEEREVNDIEHQIDTDLGPNDDDAELEAIEDMRAEEFLSSTQHFGSSEERAEKRAN
jgi:hypothetical protein